MSGSESFNEAPIEYAIKREIEFSRPESNPKLQAEFKFDSPIPVQVAQPVERIQFRKKYFNTILGILRILIIVNTTPS